MKLLIWDFDGTLAHREGRWSGVLLDVMRQHDPACALTADHFRPYLRDRLPWHTPDQPHTHLTTADAWWSSLTPLFVAAFTAHGVQDDVANTLAASVRATYCHESAWALYPDTLDALKALSEAGWTHAILSNHVPELPDIVAYLGLDSWFAAIVNSATIGYEKPHPATFQHVLTRMGPTDDVWMIGDNPHADIAGAAALGIPGILVRTQSQDVHFRCDNLSQVASVLHQAAHERTSRPAPRSSS